MPVVPFNPSASPSQPSAPSPPADDWLMMSAAQMHEEGRLLDDEGSFQRGIRNTQWFKEYVTEYGEEPDLDTKDYDYRKAWREGARPDVRDETDNNRLHWPSKYKGDNHPRRFIDGVDTREQHR